MSSTERTRVLILISGSGTNLQAIIDSQAKGELNIDIVGVISDRPDAYGLQRAAKAHIHTEIIDYKSHKSRKSFDAALTALLTKLHPDLIVLAGYMRILAEATVNAYEGKLLNVHPSLLPAYPGLNTYARALAAGEIWHGSTVHFVVPELDAGPPILQYRVKITANETEAALQARVQQGEYIIYPQAINWFTEGRITYGDGQASVDGKILTKPFIINEIE
ncbi:MAG: phosphoribosylglycinamide formyltransferase [Gammaproteobacteria bacterium]|nr:phosphoribosylglycinamide formyltransferase [Gammaproteobacteria bacterium]MCP4831538.1 phosphoribosylglycinamide formyltransferase [Gammaproteobacteria bacterium]MCP4927761.1 phosphoribosylglycinamide formyltransferase [Gammaproteobacteria bacterium]